MLIFNSPYGDPMLLDSAQGLRELHEQLERFIVSPELEASFPANTTGDPTPYEEFLGGLYIKKSTGSSYLSFSNDRWLVLSASPEDLAVFNKTLLVTEDGEHNHWYSSPVSLIIEADEWRANSES